MNDVNSTMFDLWGLILNGDVPKMISITNENCFIKMKRICDLQVQNSMAQDNIVNDARLEIEVVSE